MIKLSKKVEYALIALKYISNAKDELVTAKEISDKFNISHELLAKILQKLKKEEILISNQGMNGGYRLNKRPDQIPLYNLMNVIDGDFAIVECLQAKEVTECNMNDNCSIKSPVIKIQKEIEDLFKNKMISEFV
jgi:Rrf2 family protein